MFTTELISTSDSVTLIRDHFGIFVSKPTIVRWVRTHGLGNQPGGKGTKIFINKKKLIIFMEGKDGKNKKQ